MLKTPERPPPEPDRSIGDMIERLFDDALEYARAELELLKARGLQIGETYLRAGIFLGVAAVFGFAGLVTLFVGIAFGLARWLGPLGGAIVSTLIATGAAGLFLWLALRDLERSK
jgi:hypothetical protein